MSSNLTRYFVFWVAVEIVLMPCLPYHNIQINLITLTFDTRIKKIDVKIFLTTMVLRTDFFNMFRKMAIGA